MRSDFFDSSNLCLPARTETWVFVVWDGFKWTWNPTKFNINTVQMYGRAGALGAENRSHRAWRREGGCEGCVHCFRTSSCGRLPSLYPCPHEREQISNSLSPSLLSVIGMKYALVADVDLRRLPLLMSRIGRCINSSHMSLLLLNQLSSKYHVKGTVRVRLCVSYEVYHSIKR